MKRLGFVAAALLAGTLVAGVALGKDKKDKDQKPAEPAPAAAPAPAPAAESAEAEEEHEEHEEHHHMRHGDMKEGADPALQGVVQYRAVVMHAMGAHMGAIKHIVKGDVDRMGDLSYHADALHGAAQDMVGLVPAGTGQDKFVTDALDEIWTDQDGFKKAANDFEQATAHFQDVVKGGDKAADMQAFMAVGKACGGCHDSYREDHD